MTSRFIHLWRLPAAVVLLVAVAAGSIGGAAADGSRSQWYAAWGFSQQGLEPATTNMTDATARMIARPTISGSHLRVQIQNTFGTVPLTIGSAAIAVRINGAQLAPGSTVPLTFGGSASVTIPAGGAVYSDPAAFPVGAWQDVAVSLYTPGVAPQISRHGNARTTSFFTLAGAGDHTMDESATAFTSTTTPPTTTTTTAMWWVAAIDVYSSSADGTVVFFGDSITDGTATTTDGHDRWHDIVFLRRLLDDKEHVQLGAVNEGIGGNRVTNIIPGGSPAAVDRLDRDVLARTGATHVVFFEGTNDIAAGVNADQLMAGMQSVVDRVHAARLPIFCSTIIPRHNATWTAQMTDYRNTVNDWIRHKANCDAVIDFDKVMRSDDNPDLMNPLLDFGDHIHPNPYGYFLMGRAVDEKLFEKHIHVK
jgi:lysophospholipase L1-like esterase